MDSGALTIIVTRIERYLSPSISVSVSIGSTHSRDEEDGDGKSKEKTGVGGQVEENGLPSCCG
jgi:hypothetical protein